MIQWQQIICNKSHPWDGKKIPGVPVLHIDAKCVGESSDGGADDYECPNCGHGWRDYLDQN